MAVCTVDLAAAHWPKFRLVEASLNDAKLCGGFRFCTRQDASLATWKYETSMSDLLIGGIPCTSQPRTATEHDGGRAWQTWPSDSKCCPWSRRQVRPESPRGLQRKRTYLTPENGPCAKRRPAEESPAHGRGAEVHIIMSCSIGQPQRDNAYNIRRAGPTAAPPLSVLSKQHTEKVFMQTSFRMHCSHTHTHTQTGPLFMSLSRSRGL